MSDTVVQQSITPDALRKMQTDHLAQFLLDNSKFLEEIYHKLRGETLIEEIQEINGENVLVPVWKRIGIVKPMVNDYGLNKTMQVLNMSLTANNATGKLEDDVLRIMAFKTYVLLVKTYAIHFEKCGFENEIDMYMLANLVWDNITLHFSKSTDMSLLKELFSSYHISEIRGQDKKGVVVEPTMTL